MTIPAPAPAAPLANQKMTIESWHPTMSANGSHGHWATQHKKHHIDRDMAWASARQAGWVFVPGKVRLTITLVYPRKYRLDADNLHSRVKGLVDGLRNPVKMLISSHDVSRRNPCSCSACCAVRSVLDVNRGFFTDDSTDYLDLHVRVEVRPGERKRTEVLLEKVLP